MKIMLNEVASYALYLHFISVAWSPTILDKCPGTAKHYSDFFTSTDKRKTNTNAFTTSLSNSDPDARAAWQISRIAWKHD